MINETKQDNVERENHILKKLAETLCPPENSDESVKQISIFTPISRGVSSSFGEYDKTRITYEEHSVIFGREGPGCMGTHSTETTRGYNITEHESVNYSDGEKPGNPFFEVDPFSPTCRLRDNHYATNITKEHLIETLSRELEKIRAGEMKERLEMGYLVLEQKVGERE